MICFESYQHQFDAPESISQFLLYPRWPYDISLMSTLDMADSDGRAALRNARQDLVALLDIDDGGSRRRSLDAILGVSCASESDGAKVGERNESSVLLEVLSPKLALIREQPD